LLIELVKAGQKKKKKHDNEDATDDGCTFAPFADDTSDVDADDADDNAKGMGGILRKSSDLLDRFVKHFAQSRQRDRGREIYI
jgi:hypothetical protein